MIVLLQLDCCGWAGPKDFVSNEPIDETCYENIGQSNSGVLTRRDGQLATKRMKEEGCGWKLEEWFDDNTITWVTILASVAALQVMCIGIAIYITCRVRKMKKLR